MTWHHAAYNGNTRGIADLAVLRAGKLVSFPTETVHGLRPARATALDRAHEGVAGTRMGCRAFCFSERDRVTAHRRMR